MREKKGRIPRGPLRRQVKSLLFILFYFILFYFILFYFLFFFLILRYILMKNFVYSHVFFRGLYLFDENFGNPMSSLGGVPLISGIAHYHNKEDWVYHLHNPWWI